MAIEAISNIRTVLGLRCEERFIKAYKNELDGIHRLTLRKSQIRGVIFGFTQSTSILFWGVLYAYAGYLVELGLVLYPDAMT